MPSTATVSDVPRVAGVSVGTVSRVINGFTNITPENIAKVQAAIATLGYRRLHSASPAPKRRAGSLARTGNIGILYVEMGPEWANHPLTAAYAQGVEEACQERGYHAISESYQEESGLPRCVRERKVDGLLVRTTRTFPAALRQLPPDFPVIAVGYVDPADPIPQVAPDNRAAGFLATRFLWEKGHRRIAYLSHDCLHPMFLARYLGYEEFLRLHDAFDPARAIVGERLSESRRPETTPPPLDAELDALLGAQPESRPTAFLAANDWIAKGLYSALARRGLRIPEDVSVLGFDNTDPLCDLLEPPLSSYAIPFAATARAAALALFDRIERPPARPEPGLHLVGGKIVERQSVSAPSAPPASPAA